MDFLDDPFSKPGVAKAPTAGRFQPKAKPRPKKGPSVAVKAIEEPSVASVSQDSVVNQSVQPNDLVEKKSDAPKSSSFTETESVVSPLADGNLSAEAREVTGSAIIGHSEVAFSNPIIDKDLSVDSSLESQLPPDHIGMSTTVACWPAETPRLDASSIQNEEKLPVFPNICFASASPLKPCNSHSSPDQSIDKTFQDSECYKESIACSNVDLQIDMEQLGAGDFSCLDVVDITSEGAAYSEKRAVKFQPKPKPQSNRQKDPAVGSSQLPRAPELPSENQHTTSDDSTRAREPNTVSDILHMRLDGNFSSDPPVCQPHNLVSEDADSLMPENSQQSGENLGERNSYDAFDSSVKSVDETILSGFEGNENTYNMLDGINGGFHDNSSSYNEVPDELASNRDENDGGDHLMEETRQKKKPRKTKKVVSENDKPVRKRKKAAQEPGEATEKPPKKFPRATRRKRCVDKALLEAPEDELDLQMVPIRELIKLAEYKERQAKKEAAAVLPSTTNERTDYNLSEDPPYDDNETFGFDQDEDACDNPSTSRVQKDTGYFNYQSYMTKEPRARWTKHDTELFYKGIRQFGSDLSMIQQLFPGRTRHQIKLKYKKEQRQNPMMLDDALTSRAQGCKNKLHKKQRLREMIQFAQLGRMKSGQRKFLTLMRMLQKPSRTKELMIKSQRSIKLKLLPNLITVKKSLIGVNIKVNCSINTNTPFLYCNLILLS